jgi:hypothetical protein
MKTKKPTQSSVIPNEEGKNNMNTQIISKSMKKMFGYLLVILAILTLSACTSKAKAAGSSCNIDMGMRVTINVTDVKLQVVTDQLATNPDCAITVYPFFYKHVTVDVENATVSQVIGILCPQIKCKWILNENHLTIRPYTIIDKWQDHKWVELEQRRTILQSLLPEGMVFENVPLSAVLKEISKACGLTIKAWEDEGNRMVTMDVSGMTVDESLKAVIRYVDGEGAVLIKSGGLFGSYGQHWPWGYPPSGYP